MAILKNCIPAGSRKGAPGWLIQFSYDPEIVEALKDAVPSPFREWRKQTKEWWVDGEFEAVLLVLFDDFPFWRDQPRLEGF